MQQSNMGSLLQCTTAAGPRIDTLEQIAISSGWGGAVVRTSDSRRGNPHSNPLAVVSKLGQFRLLHVALVHSAV